jgi:hypothetical protein
LERAIVFRCFVVAVILSASSGLFFGKQAAFAVAVGAAIAGANFWLSSGFLRKMVSPETGPSVRNWKRVLSFLFRYAIVGAALVAAIRAAVRPMFLIVGVSALLIAVLASGLKLVDSEGEA